MELLATSWWMIGLNALLETTTTINRIKSVLLSPASRQVSDRNYLTNCTHNNNITLIWNPVSSIQAYKTVTQKTQAKGFSQTISDSVLSASMQSCGDGGRVSTETDIYKQHPPC